MTARNLQTSQSRSIWWVGVSAEQPDLEPAVGATPGTATVELMGAVRSRSDRPFVDSDHVAGPQLLIGGARAGLREFADSCRDPRLAPSFGSIDKNEHRRWTPCHTYDVLTMSVSPLRTSTR
jgi:hypothetical protein